MQRLRIPGLVGCVFSAAVACGQSGASHSASDGSSTDGSLQDSLRGRRHRGTGGSTSAGSGGQSTSATGGNTTSSSGGRSTSGTGGNTTSSSGGSSGQSTTGTGGNTSPPSGGSGGQSTTGTGGTSTSGGGSGSATPPPSPPARTPAAFPLSLSSAKKYLVDSQQKPFLLRGDAAWSLIAQPSEADATKYLNDRQNRNFNTILVSLIEHKFTGHTPPWADAAGDVPFPDITDFTTTNEAYFAHADWVIQQAQQRGILVLLVPAYLGYGCGDEGWCSAMAANGVAKLKQYGQFVGARYKNYPNIVWVEGGDHTPSTSGSPSEMDLVNAVATGIKAGDGGSHLHTAHWDGETSAADVSGLSWLDIDSTYSDTAPHLYVKSLSDYTRDIGVRPVFLIESHYENEHGSTPLQLRAEMWQPVFSGSMGFVFGNFPMWSFWVPGNPAWQFDDGAYPGGWSTALGSPGAKDVTALGNLLTAVNWQNLQPDTKHTVMVSGYGSYGSDTYTLVASTPDKSLAVAYFTSNTTGTIDMSAMKGSTTAYWFDPSTGTYKLVPNSPFPNSGKVGFTPPGNNADGSADWVLLLQSP